MTIQIDLGLEGSFENKILSEEQIVEHVIRNYRYTFPVRILQYDMVDLVEATDILSKIKDTFVDNIRTGRVLLCYLLINLPID